MLHIDEEFGNEDESLEPAVPLLSVDASKKDPFACGCKCQNCSCAKQLSSAIFDKQKIAKLPPNFSCCSSGGSGRGGGSIDSSVEELKDSCSCSSSSTSGCSGSDQPSSSTAAPAKKGGCCCNNCISATINRIMDFSISFDSIDEELAAQNLSPEE